MALTNIFNEPVREITETLVGIVVGVPAGVGDYFLAKAIQSPIDSFFWSLLMATFLIIIGTIVMVFSLIFVHLLGEFVCDVLQDHAVFLRPKRRR